VNAPPLEVGGSWQAPSAQMDRLSTAAMAKTPSEGRLKRVSPFMFDCSIFDSSIRKIVGADFSSIVGSTSLSSDTDLPAPRRLGYY